MEEEEEDDDEMDARGGGDCTADCCEAARDTLPAPVPVPPLGAADTIGRDAGRRASAATSGWISAARAELTCSTPASAAELERLPISVEATGTTEETDAELDGVVCGALRLAAAAAAPPAFA